MIESSKKQDNSRVVTPIENISDKTYFSNILRPMKLEDYVWQDSIKKHLSVSINSSKIRWECLDHILFYWPPWLWKTTISNIIAHEMESNLRSTSWPAIEKQSDLVSILSNLEEGDILFIDEIFADIWIDELWLDYLDKKYLRTILEKFNSWPVWLNTLSSAIWEEESTIEDVVEPYLLQIGFIERTPRGRKITLDAINHLKK